MTEQRLRIRSVPLTPAIITGAWSGFVPGLFIGGVAGAIASFAAGAALEWMRELSFTTGIQEQLLPFGSGTDFMQKMGGSAICRRCRTTGSSSSRWSGWRWVSSAR